MRGTDMRTTSANQRETKHGGQRPADADVAGTQAMLPHLDGPQPLARCCGLDEVGRGALAGPLVAAAVVLPEEFARQLGTLAPFLRDSKTVPAARREEVAAQVRLHAPLVEVVVIPVTQINARGIGWANREAFRRLIERAHTRGAPGGDAEDLDSGAENRVDEYIDEYIVDGRILPPVPRWRVARVRCLVRADAQIPAVAAASLVAKVHRDALMRALHKRHPQYGWNTNVGYGTAAHLAALRAHGPCFEHRDQFVRTALGHDA